MELRGGALPEAVISWLYTLFVPTATGGFQEQPSALRYMYTDASEDQAEAQRLYSFANIRTAFRMSLQCLPDSMIKASADDFLLRAYAVWNVRPSMRADWAAQQKQVFAHNESVARGFGRTPLCQIQDPQASEIDLLTAARQTLQSAEAKSQQLTLAAAQREQMLQSMAQQVEAAREEAAQVRAAADHAIASLKDEFLRREQEISRQTDVHIVAETANLQTKITSLVKEISDLKASAAQRDEVWRAQTKAEIESLKRSHAEQLLAARSSEKDQRLAELKSMQAEFTTRFSAEETKRKALEALRDKLSATLTSVTAERNQAVASLTRAQEELSAAKSGIDEHRIELAKARRALDEATTLSQGRLLELQKTCVEEKSTALATFARESKADRARAEASVRSAEAAVSALKTDLATERGRVDALVKDNDLLRSSDTARCESAVKQVKEIERRACAEKQQENQDCCVM